MGTIETNEEIENNQNEVEPSPFEDHCPRHGTRIRRHVGCPKCVMEEVRRHEKRMEDLLMLDEPIPTESIQQTTAPLAEMR